MMWYSSGGFAEGSAIAHKISAYIVIWKWRVRLTIFVGFPDNDICIYIAVHKVGTAHSGRSAEGSLNDAQKTRHALGGTLDGAADAHETVLFGLHKDTAGARLLLALFVGLDPHNDFAAAVSISSAAVR